MPRAKLDRQMIVSMAIDIADVEGFAFVSMRGIASRLGVHVTSLYNHIPTKESLFEEIVTSLIDEAALPTAVASWQEWVHLFANGMRDLAHNHPGAIEAVFQRPVQGAKAAATFEVALKAFRDDGFDASVSYDAVKAVVLAVFGQLLHDMAGLKHPGLQTDMSVLSADEFPILHEAATTMNNANTFNYMIQVLINGISASRPNATFE